MIVTRVETVRLPGQSLPGNANADERNSKVTEQNLIWVRLHTDEGLVGLGETFYGPRAVEAVIHETFAPFLLGRNPLEIERNWRDMFRIADHSGYGGAELRAISAIDIALWDVTGKAAGRPLYELLGGKCRDHIRVYNTGIYGTDAVSYARENLERGLTAMKVGVFPPEHHGDGYAISPADVDKLIHPVRAIKEELGGAIEVAVDGHGFWSAPAAAMIARALEPYQVLWLEELMSPRNANAYLKLAQSTAIPICLAERFVTRFQFREYIERGIVDIVMPDLLWTGGLSEARRIASMAEIYQLPVCPHDCTGPVNMFACAHLCMNLPNAFLMETSRSLYDNLYLRLVQPNITVEDGYLLAPEGPGLGTELSEEVLARPDAMVVATADGGGHPYSWRQ
ncbi:MAG: mandelate racemase/muconate lactonizing enzyme family protein [Streptosporangiaceae bacterium]